MAPPSQEKLPSSAFGEIEQTIKLLRTCRFFVGGIALIGGWVSSSYPIWLQAHQQLEDCSTIVFIALGTYDRQL